MARIPEDELAQIKRETDLVGLVRESGIELVRHGKDWLGRCRWHPDNSPSLVVSPERGLFHCMGACQTGGSAIDFVMRDRQLTFLEAVDYLRCRLSAATTNGNGSHPPAAPAAAAPTPLDAAAQAHLARVWQIYRDTYIESAEAQEYAARRGIAHPEAIERFGLGYADRTLAQRLGLDDSSEGRQLREALKSLGIFRRDTGHEHQVGNLVFAIPGGPSPLNLYGRRIKDSADGARHFYLPGPRRGIWNPEGLAGTSELILAESLIDGWTFWCAGLRHVTASYGTNGFTADHLAALQRAGIERLLIAYDNDRAGNDAAKKLAEKLGAFGIGCFRVVFPRGLDANEYARKVTPARESLALALRAAEWMAGPQPAIAVSVPAAVARESGSAPSEPGDSAPETPIAEVSSAATSPTPPADALSTPSVTPTSPATSPPAIDAKQPVDVAFGDRRWRVRGLDRNLSHEKLQVLLRVARGSAFFVDTVDLAQAKQRAGFVRAAAAELELEEEAMKKDLAKVHLKLEELQDQLIRQQLAPKPAEPEPMAAAAEAAAIAFLRRPDLLAAILADFARCGVVGEESNKLLGYVAATSRKLERPLAVILQSSSAAGKSSLMEAILAFMPEQERVQYSAMTGQSLFYMGETDLRHKILAIVEEEGAERASYALKLLQSEGELTIASTGKDPETGRLITHEYRVEGPVAIFLTTTAIEIDEELLNRCLILSVDESREQTRAIHRLQREGRTLEGMLARRERETLVELHRNVQRLLRPFPVVNPYAPRLTFLDSQTRTRRDHEKYLTLIDAIALLHQHQRPLQRAVDRQGRSVEYLAVEPADVALANRLAGEVLGRSLDELPPQTRRFLTELDRVVTEDCAQLEIDRGDYRFFRRHVAERTGWSYNQTRKHLDRLVDLEYVVPHRGGRGQSFVYELVYDGQGRDGRPFLLKLIDVEVLAGRGTPESLTPSEESLTPAAAPIDPPLAAHLPPIDPRLPTGEKRSNSKDQKLLQSPGGKASRKSRSRSPETEPAPDEPETLGSGEDQGDG